MITASTTRKDVDVEKRDELPSITKNLQDRTVEIIFNRCTGRTLVDDDMHTKIRHSQQPRSDIDINLLAQEKLNAMLLVRKFSNSSDFRKRCLPVLQIKSQGALTK
ncbi:hypothetical protein FRX31_027281 [Thalictrum thalictroides]|uniref:Uncharacterized protein n=1 Tax=Thalictrum thalictroides TaxID=46969 RepID=A0A7J6VFN7_THATH|nr:hypothetical protein FRX31_027281 [Thalictrum thalictroides]